MDPLLATMIPVGIIILIAVSIPCLVLVWIRRAEDLDTEKLIAVINTAMPTIKAAREKMERELREARK